MTKRNRSAPTILAGIATPSSNRDYTVKPTTGSPLRLEEYRSIEDEQISGGEDMSEQGRCLAMWLSALMTIPLAEFLAEFREFAAVQPVEAKAIAAALSEFLLRQTEEQS